MQYLLGFCPLFPGPGVIDLSMSYPLKKNLYLTAGLVAAVFMLVVMLAIGQSMLNSQYDEIVSQSETLIFQYATVKEHITESLLEGRYEPLPGIAGEVESLNRDLSRLLDSPLVAGEIKLGFVNQVDLPGIVLLLRKMERQDNRIETARQLNREIRVLGDRLVQFDRIIVGQLKAKLVRFQNLVIGGLALVVCLVSFLLLLWSRRVVLPLITLARQMQQGSFGGAPLTGEASCLEIEQVRTSVNRLLDQQQISTAIAERRGRILAALAKAGQVIEKAASRRDLYAGLCRALLQDSDYCLVWIGEQAKSGERIEPLAVDGSTSMDQRESAACLEVLSAAVRDKGSAHDPALLVLENGEPLVVRDLLEDAPKGLLKNTPFAEGRVHCAALPLAWDGAARAVLIIYSASAECFTDDEMQLLRAVCAEAAAAEQLLLRSGELSAARSRLAAVMSIQTDISLLLDPAGGIAMANEAAARSFGMEAGSLVGQRLLDLLADDGSQELSGRISETLTQGKAASFEVELTRPQGRFQLHLLPCKDENGGVVEVVFRACSVQEQSSAHELLVQICGLAAIGELATGVAHEVNNLINGIINFSQILLDEVTAASDGGKQPMLRKMIDDGERIGEVLRQLLYLTRKQHQMHRSLVMGNVVEGAVDLLARQLKEDGIRVEVDFSRDLPHVYANHEYLQLVLLNLLTNCRYALNQRYTGRNENKRLRIAGSLVEADGRSWLRTSVTDWGGGVDPKILPRLCEPLFSTKPATDGTGLGLTLSQLLIAEHQGELRIDSAAGESTTVVIDLPVAEKSAAAVGSVSA